MRCPVCKAENTLGPLCRRCKADLTLLFQLEEQRDRLLNTARSGLASGERAEALEQAESGDWMRRDPESMRLLALAHLLNRDFASAWRLYLALQDGPDLPTAERPGPARAAGPHSQPGTAERQA